LIFMPNYIFNPLPNFLQPGAIAFRQWLFVTGKLRIAAQRCLIMCPGKC